MLACNFTFSFFVWGLIVAQHPHNMGITLSHMRVGLSVGPPSCERVLCSCCVGVVKLAFPFVFSLDKAICNTITFCSSGKKEKKNKLD